MMRKLVVISIAVMLSATAALASWYDDYDAGLAAIRKGNWQAAIKSMTDAIKAKPQESDKARTYGTQFINYHPYYYRGVAYLNTGQYDKAIADLEQATGIGEENVGPIEQLMQRAKSKLAQASTPEPQPQPAAPQPQPKPAPVPVPVQPAAPTINPALRQSAANAVTEADQARTKAASRPGASASPNFSQGMTQLVDARNKAATAKSDDDLNAAIAAAGNAKMFFDSAAGTAVATAPTPTPQPPTKITQATNLTVGSLAERVHRALEAYFAGDFETASARFQILSSDMPKNGWIYAFLGASQYSMYAFERDENYKAKAMQSFKKAKQLRFKDGELPTKYFSKRIRKAFREAEG